MRKKIVVNKLAAGCIIFIFIITGCNKQKAGEAIPAREKKVSLSEVIALQEKYNGSKVLLEGNYGGICGSGCCQDFYLNQGLSTIKVMVGGIKVPGFKPGSPLRVYGILKTTRQSPFVQALGMEAME